MMGPCTLLAILIILVFSGICPVLAALPDLVVRITSTALSRSNSLIVDSGDNDASVEILAKRAQFGSRDDLLEGILVYPPDYDSLLCERYKMKVDVFTNGNIDLVTLPPYPKPDEKNSTVMLVPRGECSYERKAYAAKHFYGAKGIMIYDRLDSRYFWNTSSSRVIFPQAIRDYECGYGSAVMHNLTLDPPAYNATQLDPLMGLTTIMTKNTATTGREESSGEASNEGFNAGITTVCNLTNTALKPCESQLCLVVSHSENSTDYPVCCAWDTPQAMPVADDANDLNTDDILAVWLTIRQSELIFQSDLLSFESEVSIETRGSKSAFNATYIIMWMWGTLVMMVGAWYAARDYRRFGAKLTAYKESEEKNQTSHRNRDLRRPQPNGRSIRKTEDRMSLEKNRVTANKRREIDARELQGDLESGEHSFQDEMGDRIVGKDPQQKIRNGKKHNMRTNKKKSMKTKPNNAVWSLHSLPPPERKQKQKIPMRNKDKSNTRTDDDNSTSILPARESGTITPFEMTQWHVLGFVVMASLTLVLLYFFKWYTFIFVLYSIGCAGAISYLVFNPLVAAVIPKFGNSWVEKFNKDVIFRCNGFSITSQVMAYVWVGVWIWYGITHYRPQTNAFFWISLNILGACFCILSISVLKLNSIKIATILLVAIFFYDIFFVFITPFITGGASVMLQVASGSADPSGEEYCYKYPDSRWCKGIGFLPMLFIFPKTNDYANGSVLLGLGDIILPGFLIAFSARHDEALRLIGAHIANPGVESPTKWYKGYFFPMLIAYSLGLFFAFLAVILMEQGQPALLYICPICLTTIFIIGRRDLKNLWSGAKVFKLADGLITKTERDWGKTRMKRFVQRRKRENAQLVASSGNEVDHEQHSTRMSTETPLGEPTTSPAGSTPSDHVQPRSKDICFGHEDHPGTRAFRNVVEEVAADSGEEEFKPEIYKIIRKKLKGRHFFMTSNIVWAEASKLETRKQIGRAYDLARGIRSTVLEDVDPLSET